MAKKTRFAHLYDLTKRGAQARLRDLKMEAALLMKLFPDLRDSFDPDEMPISFLLKRDARRASGRTPGARKRR